MRIVRNAGTDRVLDLARPGITPGGELDIVSPAFSLFAFADLHEDLFKGGHARLVLPPDDADLALLGGTADRGRRNQLQLRWLAARCAEWLITNAEVRRAASSVPQGALVLRDAQVQPQQVFFGFPKGILHLHYHFFRLGFRSASPCARMGFIRRPTNRRGVT